MPSHRRKRSPSQLLKIIIFLLFILSCLILSIFYVNSIISEQKVGASSVRPVEVVPAESCAQETEAAVQISQEPQGFQQQKKEEEPEEDKDQKEEEKEDQKEEEKEDQKEEEEDADDIDGLVPAPVPCSNPQVSNNDQSTNVVELTGNNLQKDPNSIEESKSGSEIEETETFEIINNEDVSDEVFVVAEEEENGQDIYDFNVSEDDFELLLNPSTVVTDEKEYIPDIIIGLIKERKLDIIKNLINFLPELLAGPIIDGLYLIHLAVRSDYPELIDELIARGACVNICTANVVKMKPIHFVCTSETLLKLLEAGAEIDAVDGNGETALTHTIIKENYELVKNLLNNGSDPNKLIVLADNNETLHIKTNLNIAASVNDLEMVRLLLDHKADPNLKDSLMMNALHTAVFYDHFEIVKYLLDSKCVNVNSKMEPSPALGTTTTAVSPCLGCTPLHVAVERGNFMMVSLLLSEGADLNALDGNDRKPLHMTSDWKIKNLLLRFTKPILL